MAAYDFPAIPSRPKAGRKQVLLVANGDLRHTANRRCWAAQKQLEEDLSAAVADAGYELVRAHPYKPDQEHGFIASQREGMDVFAAIDPKAPLIVAINSSGEAKC